MACGLQGVITAKLTLFKFIRAGDDGRHYVYALSNS